MRRGRLASIAEITGSKELADLASSDVLWDRVVSIEPIGEQPVFDATVLGTHNFVANGIVAHNSLEQDADVVVFLYRDEQYNPDSPDRGTAEVLVTKELTQDDAEAYDPASSTLCTDLITAGGLEGKVAPANPDIGYFGLTTDSAPNAGDKLVCIGYRLDGAKLDAPL